MVGFFQSGQALISPPPSFQYKFIKIILVNFWGLLSLFFYLNMKQQLVNILIVRFLKLLLKTSSIKP